MGRKLTDSQINEAIQLRLVGKSAKTIGAYLGVSTSTVRRELYPHRPENGWPNVKRTKLTNEQMNDIIARRVAGESIPAIVQATGVTHGVICNLTRHVPKPAGGWKKRRAGQLTEAHKKQILSLQPTMSCRAIAESLEVSKRAVERFLRKVRPPGGWPSHFHTSGKLSETKKRNIIRRRLQGETLADIARRYGVSIVAVHKIVKDIPLGYRPRKRKLSPTQVEAAITRRLAGEPLQDIANSYGVTAPHIHKITQSAKPLMGWPKPNRKKRGS